VDLGENIGVSCSSSVEGWPGKTGNRCSCTYRHCIFTFLDFFQRLFAVRATKDHLLGEPISVVEPALAHFAWFLPFSTIDGVQVGGGSLAAMADQ